MIIFDRIPNMYQYWQRKLKSLVFDVVILNETKIIRRKLS